MKELILEVITPAKKAYEGKVKSVTLPGALGSFQVLFNHAPILSSLDIGEVTIVDEENNESHFAVGGGTAEVLDNKVLILAESFEKAEDIDVDGAEKAKERAKARLKHKTSEIDELRAELALKRAINRLKIHSKYC